LGVDVAEVLDHRDCNAGPDGLIAENSSSTMSIRRGSFVVVVRLEVAAIVVPVLARRLPATR
jgi:hypothetical protein